jgi:TM2 domain-containing protein
MTLPEMYDDGDGGDGPEDAEGGERVSKRSRGVALLLSFFGGWFGLDRFYVDKIGTAIPKLLTFGGLGIWWLYDCVLIAAGEFRDGEDLPLRNWGLSESSFTQRRLVGRAEQRVNELEEQLDALRQQFNDLAERVDFAERLLAQRRDDSRSPPQLPRGS